MSWNAVVSTCLENWQRILAFTISTPVMGWLAYLFFTLPTERLFSLEYGMMVSSVLISLCVYLATDLSVQAQKKANEIQMRPRVYPYFPEWERGELEREVKIVNQGSSPAYVTNYTLLEEGSPIEEVESLYLGPGSTCSIGEFSLGELENGEFVLEYENPATDKSYEETFEVA